MGPTLGSCDSVNFVNDDGVYFAQRFLARDVSIKNRDSGVVIRMSGGFDNSERRSAAVVSPERTPTVTSGAGSPNRLAVCVIPMSGERRFRSTSTPSALRGDI